MKFFCDNCSTQYLISDDKIGPRGVKVRCKRCGNVIILRKDSQAQDQPAQPETPSGDKPQREDEVGEAFDQLLKSGLEDSADSQDDDEEEEQATELFNVSHLQFMNQQQEDKNTIDEAFRGAESTELNLGSSVEAADTEWYVAIGDEQVGPLVREELETKWSAGEINAGSLAWHPGLANWTAISELSELTYLTGTPVNSAYVSENEDSEAPDSDSELWSSGQSSELASLVEDEKRMVESSEPGDGLADMTEPNLFDQEDDEDIPPWEREDSESRDAIQPSENFFDSSLDRTDGAQAKYFDTTFSRSQRVLSGPAYLTGKTASKRRLFRTASLVGGLVLISTALFYWLSESPQNSAPTVDTSPVAPPEVAGGLETVTPRSEAGVDSKQEPEEVILPGSKPAKMVVRRAVVAAATQSAENKSRRMRPKKNREAPNEKTKNRQQPKKEYKALAPKKEPQKREPKKKIASGADVPQKLDKSSVTNILRKYVASMKGCVKQQQQRDPSVSGTMRVSFVINPSGKVRKVTINSQEHRDTYVADCISFIIKSMIFPQSQQPFTVPNLPLRLGD